MMTENCIPRYVAANFCSMYISAGISIWARASWHSCPQMRCLICGTTSSQDSVRYPWQDTMVAPETSCLPWKHVSWDRSLGNQEAFRTALLCSQSNFVVRAALVEALLWLTGDELKHLTSLTVCATSICITMPSSLRLQRLCVCARNKLCLHFDSVEETGSHLRAFDITCRYLLHQEPIDALQVYIRLVILAAPEAPL